jgi:xanthine dehydrogenase YagS FAD-binding subunit
MKAFELYEPAGVAEALQTLAQLGPKAKLLGGGSDLVGGIMKDWVSGKGMPLPEALIDLTSVPGLDQIDVGADGARLGATTTLTDITEHKDLQQQYPLLTQATLSIASPLIRNFGTLGGNINQRPRCWFFRGEGFNCYKKGGDFCFAVTGDNRYHAIIGGELCYIVHPSDTSTALLALNASARLSGSGGERTVPFDNYFHGPREDVLTENVLKPDEILLEVQIPKPAAGTKMGWTKIKDRQVYDFAIASVAVAFMVDGSGVWQNGRVVLGGVAPVPYRATVVEDALKGKDVRATAKAAAAQIRTVARPMSLNGYKIDLVQGVIERTLLQALG